MSRLEQRSLRARDRPCSTNSCSCGANDRVVHVFHATEIVATVVDKRPLPKQTRHVHGRRDRKPKNWRLDAKPLHVFVHCPSYQLSIEALGNGVSRHRHRERVDDEGIGRVGRHLPCNRLSQSQSQLACRASCIVRAESRTPHPHGVHPDDTTRCGQVANKVLSTGRMASPVLSKDNQVVTHWHRLALGAKRSTSSADQAPRIAPMRPKHVRRTRIDSP